jgi:ectoine hydroxylase-related dioxygenase (phytanoyl-CoA dioxygenase family)
MVWRYCSVTAHSGSGWSNNLLWCARPLRRWSVTKAPAPVGPDFSNTAPCSMTWSINGHALAVDNGTSAWNCASRRTARWPSARRSAAWARFVSSTLALCGLSGGTHRPCTSGEQPLDLSSTVYRAIATTGMGDAVLTPRSKFFETFGFLRLPGLLADDIGWISDEFDAIWSDRTDIRHDGSHRTIYPDAFLNASPVLAQLIEHPLLSAITEEILGPKIAYYGGDGNYYAGDTGWHRDVFRIPDGEEGKTIVRHIKIAFYLDPLTASTGALRVIPGSHHLGDRFAQQLREYVANGSTDLGEDGSTDLGVSSADIPALALPVAPGDILMFDHRIMHASFGGGPVRRMFAMNLFEQCDTNRQRELTARLFRMYGSQGMPYFFSENVTRNAPAERLRRLEPALEFEAARAEGYAEYCHSDSALHPAR